MKIFGVDFSARSEVRDAPLGGMTSWGRFFSGWDIDGPAGAVSTAEALAVPAFWAGVNFLSASLAALPIHVYKVTKNGSERVEGGVNSLLQHAPNDETIRIAPALTVSKVQIDRFISVFAQCMQEVERG